MKKDLQPDGFTFTSLGRDAAEGGAGFDQDIIISWKKGSETISVDAWDLER